MYNIEQNLDRMIKPPSQKLEDKSARDDSRKCLIIDESDGRMYIIIGVWNIDSQLLNLFFFYIILIVMANNRLGSSEIFNGPK